MSCRTSLLAGLVVTALAQTAEAQEWAIAPGQRLRVTAAAPAADGRARRVDWVGVLRYATPDSLVIDPVGGREVMALAWPEVVEVRRHAGRKGNAAKGALIGGVALGLLGLAGDISCSGSESLGCPSTGAGTLGFGLAGAGAGALIGWAVRSDKWERVDPPRFEVVPSAQEGRPGIALRLSF